MIKVYYEVEGMNCQSCVKKINDELSGIEGVTLTEVNLEEKSVNLEIEEYVSAMMLKTKIGDLGFSVHSMKKE